MQQPLASIPSPSQGVWHLGPLPIRAYALMIILGIIVAVWLGERRWTARGGAPGTVIDIAVWAVPFGLVGGRLYHVITDNQLYFGAGKHPLDALKIWNGGLGIWGAVMLGALGVYLGCRRRGINMRPMADALAPGIAFGQTFGRWGNYFNQELYGRPLHAPWALEIDAAHRPKLANGDIDPKYQYVTTYHPTFLYESLWCLIIGLVVIWAGRRFRLNWGRTFALYVALYTVGRAYFEWLRIDSAHHFLGLRLNDYTALVIFLCAVAYLYVFRNKSDVPEPLTLGPQPPSDQEAEPSGDAPTGSANVRIEDEPEEPPADRTGELDKPEQADKGDEGDAEKAETGTAETGQAKKAEQTDEPTVAQDNETVNGRQ